LVTLEPASLEEEDVPNKTIKRREFLKYGATLAIGTVAAACTPAAPPPAQIVKVTVEVPVQQTVAVKETVAVAQTVVVKETVAAPTRFKEAQALADLVKAGKLPPVDQRLPESPIVEEPVTTVGQYGGTLRMIGGDDTMGQLRMMIGCESLVKWKRDLSSIRPNVVQSWTWNDTATELTCQFRKGIKWSDGQPFTVDDYLFFWNDMVMNETIGLSTPAATRVNGTPMTLTKIDDYTLKFTFAAANPLFMDLSARGYYNSAQHLVPAHYLKKFHPKYDSSNKDAKELLARYTNPPQYVGMPTLDAWMVTDFKSGDRATFVRNPYYWKVDPEGNQLPYIDNLNVNLVPAGGNANELTLLQSVAGNVDFQIRDYAIKDVPLLKENAAKGGYTVKTWSRGDFAWPWIMLFYDYVPDKAMEDLMYNQQWRQALSYAIDREKINQVVYNGLGVARQAALSPESPEFRTNEGKAVYQKWSTLAASYSPDQAKALLDAAKIVDVNGDGLREKPDGSKLELIVSVDQGDKESIDAMQLVKANWEALGLKTVIAPDEVSVFNANVGAGKVMIRAWGSAAAWGLISASPVWAPVEGVSYCGGGQRIGQWYQTGGKEGIAPRPGSMLEKLQKAYTNIITTVDPAQRTTKLLAAYQIQIDDGPITIGTVGDHPSFLVVNAKMANVPDFGLVAGWDVSFPGTADPEQFFYKS
jgi:peptide/nickel transport system substrate-binding protein